MNPFYSFSAYTVNVKKYLMVFYPSLKGPDFASLPFLNILYGEEPSTATDHSTLKLWLEEYQVIQ